LQDHLKRRTPMGHIKLPKWRAVKTPIQLGLNIKIIDNPNGTNSNEIFNQILFPASQLPLFVGLLHSLMCSLHWDDRNNFGTRSTLEMSLGKLGYLNSKQLYDKLLKPFEGLWGFKKAKIRAQGKRDLQIRTLESELQKPAISTLGWAVAMFHLHDDAMMVMERKPLLFETTTRDYYLDLVEKMRAPCEQVDLMKALPPGPLQEIHQLRWLARLGLVRHEFYLGLEDVDLPAMRWTEFLDELKRLRQMCENDIPMYPAEARPTQAAISEYTAALADPAEASADHTLYDENDKRMIWGLHSAVAGLLDNLPELCRDTWYLANSSQADDDDREEYEHAIARYRKKYKRDYDHSVHSQTG